ncbi:hypothetical protein PM082_006248 [Marasmius tenuissimus]|nr:hypothetical protein PM082_006248 [Marasmius tenuissimus]
MDDLQYRPPRSVDLDHLKIRERRALKALNAYADASKAFRPIVDQDNWSKISPWLALFCRGVLDKPSPATSQGMEVAFEVISIVPFFFVYPMNQDGNGDNYRTLLEPLLASTPGILTLAMEMWLHSTMTESPCIEQLTNAVGLLLETHRVSVDSPELPEGKATKAFTEVVRDTQRWPDIPGACIKGIIWHLGLPLINCYTLRSLFTIFSTISQGVEVNLHMPLLLQKGAIRWTASVVAKLGSTKNYFTGPGFEFNDAKMCMQEAMRFLVICSTNSVECVSEALDHDILVSIHKAREMIMEEHRRSEHERSDLSLLIYLFLDKTIVSLIHRTVLMRAVRNFRKIERLEPGSWESTWPSLKDCGFVYDHWLQLDAELLRRYEIKHSSEPYVDQNTLRICGFHQCLRAKELNDSDTYFRCSGCHADVYCSAQCQRLAWLLTGPHSMVCKARRKSTRDGERAEPGHLEFVALRKQLAFDIRSNADRIKRLKDQYYLHHMAEQAGTTRSHLVVWMDYAKYPIEMEVMPFAEGERRFGELAKHPLQEKESDSDAIEAVARVPWSHGQERPIILIHREPKKKPATRWSWRSGEYPQLSALD